MNPFGMPMPVESLKNLLYRESAVSELESRINNRQQTAILGVEGVGKSSLLKSFFCPEYRMKKALEGILISPVTEFPTDHNADSCFLHFTKMIVSAVKILGHCGMEDTMRKILAECKNCSDEAEDAQEQFEKTMDCIRQNSYRIVMVIDNFERFTSSKNITQSHHDTLLKLLENSQYVVATNYDLNKDSLPDDVSSSLFLTRFGEKHVELKGWGREECIEFMKTKLHGNNIQFSPNTLDIIYRVSGGIPTLLSLAAQFAYDYIEANGTENGLKFFPDFYKKDIVNTLLSHWCRMLSHEQKDALRDLRNGIYTDRKAYHVLYSRGLLNHTVKTDIHGHEVINDRRYEFCCMLLGSFCGDGDNLEEAMGKNPLREMQDRKTNLQGKIRRIPFDPQKPYIFISYSHKNELDVYEDVFRLKNQFNCWIDFENLDGGRMIDEDDWTEKVKPVLESPLCVGVIMYLSPEAIKDSIGTLQEAIWVNEKKPPFYTFYLNFFDDLSPQKMASFLHEKVVSNGDIQAALCRQNAFSFICQISKSKDKATYYQVSKTFSHLQETDFINWTKRIFKN